MGGATNGTKPKRATWRDAEWTPEGASEPEPLLTRDEVLDRLAALRSGVSTSVLRYWEREAVLPQPVRQSHKGAVRAVYPWWFPHAVAEVRRLQRLGLPLPEIAPHVRAFVRAGLNDVGADDPVGRWSDLDLPPAMTAELEQFARRYEQMVGTPVTGIEVLITDEHGNEAGYPLDLRQMPRPTK